MLDGCSRLAAAREAGLGEVPCIEVKGVRDARRYALVKNGMRRRVSTGTRVLAYVEMNYAEIMAAQGYDALTVDVVDDGEGIENPTDGGGNGLRGMYERVTSMGGTLKAGPLAGRPGFRVTASIPFRDNTPAPARRS